MKDKEKKFTALHYAAYYAQYDALKELVRMGADPNMPDHDDNTPTLLCCVDPAQERCLKYLCQKGGDLKVINADGMDGFMLGQDRPAIHNIYEQVARPSNVKKLRNPRYGAF
uniref:ANK_REP_REGION domain-containing protein n=1 Tax=Panagrellus redivivus TaxID=6233 RepID=A0A7E4VA05_PANRE